MHQHQRILLTLATGESLLWNLARVWGRPTFESTPRSMSKEYLLGVVYYSLREKGVMSIRNTKPTNLDCWMHTAREDRADEIPV